MAEKSKELPEHHIDLIAIAQLHAAVLATGQNCFELKKLCATVLVPAAVLVQNFTQERASRGEEFLDMAFFVGALLIIVAFWIADGVSNYYQASLRHRMNAIAEQWQKEKGSSAEVRRPLSPPPKWFRPPGAPNRAFVNVIGTLVNASMAFYLVLFSIDALLFVLWKSGAVNV